MSNPTQGDPSQGGKAEDTAQWWSTPPASTNPGVPLTGTDPTLFNANPGAPLTGTDPTLFNANPGAPLTGTDPTLFNANPGPPLTGTDQTLLNVTAGQFAPPAGVPQQPYPQQPYAQQTFPQAPPPQAAPGHQSQPYQYAQQPGYPYSGRPRPSSSKAGWIIGGIFGLVLIVAAVVGVVALSKSGGGDSVIGDDKQAWDGNYGQANVSDACSLVDRSTLSAWATRQEKAPEHTETKGDDRFGGGALRCTVENKGIDKSSSDSAQITMDARFASKYGGAYYDNWKDTDTKTSGSGRTSGAVSGIGEQAYYASEEQIYSSFTRYEYRVGVKDSNLSVKVEIQIRSTSPIDKDEVATAAKAQAQKVLDGLRK